MAEGEKNLEELFYFAQSLLKEVENKKKEISNQESERGQSFMSLSSFRDRRDKALRYREWKQKFCNLTNRSNLAKSVDKVKDLEIKWSEQKRSQLLDTHNSLSGYQKFLSTNDGDRNSHWENTQQSTTQDSYPNLIRKAIGRTKSQGPTQSQVHSSEEKFYLLFGEKEAPKPEVASPIPVKIISSIKKQSVINDSDSSLVDESYNYRSANPSPKVTAFPKEIPINKSPFANKRPEPVSTKYISAREHNDSSFNRTRDDQSASPERTNSAKKRITEMSPYKRDFLKRNIAETPKKATTVGELLKSKTVHIPSTSMTSWNTPQAKKTEVPASFRTSITSACKGEQSPAQSSRIESRARSASIKEQASSSSKIRSQQGIKNQTATALNDTKEKSPAGKDSLFTASTPLGTIMEKRKLMESLKARVQNKGRVDQQQQQSSARVPLQSSRNSVRLPNNGGDMSPSKAMRTTTSIRLLSNENKTRENTLNDDDSATSAASPNTSQIEKNLRDRRNVRSNSCQASKDLKARNNSNSPELPRKKIGQNNSSTDHLKKGNSFREGSTTSKKNLGVKANLTMGRNTSETTKKMKEPVTPNRFSKGKESRSNILKFEKDRLIQDMLSKLNNEKHKKGLKVK